MKVNRSDAYVGRRFVCLYLPAMLIGMLALGNGAPLIIVPIIAHLIERPWQEN